jgi:hypothetical protein
LDDRSHKTATVAAGGSLLELRKTVHPRLNNLVLLAHKATTQGSGIDLIYKLLYQTRDQVQESKNKVIKNEKAAQANYKRTHLAFLEDIGTLYLRIAALDITIGRLMYQVYYCKRSFAVFDCMYWLSRHDRFQGEFDLFWVNFNMKKSYYFWSVQTASLKNEKAALEKVAKMLVDMKWSAKVYNAVADVNLGVVYLNGEYNIRSAFNRYMTVYTDAKAGTVSPRFDARGAHHYAEKLDFQLQKGDLSYYIVWKKAVKDKKPLEYYLTQVGKEKVEFSRVPNAYSKWTMFYHTESGRMFIKNRKSEQSLYVHKKNSEYTVNVLQQSTEFHSQFYIERPEYSLSGCYKWRETKKLDMYNGASEEQNTESCYKNCQKMAGKTLKYFGLRSGKQCYCGTSSNFAKEVAPLAECGYVCPGRDGDLCGGPMRIIIHEVKGTDKKETVVQRYKYEFCPAGFTTQGGPGAAIAGCGIAKCDTTTDTMKKCADKCKAEAKCHSFTFSPKNANPDKLYKDKTVCTLFSATVPNTKIINKDATELQTFCAKNK